MLRNVLFVAFVFQFFGQVATQGPNATCTQAQSDQDKQCFQTFYNHYGPPKPFNFNNYVTAFTAILNATGQFGFDQQCLWQVQLEECQRNGNTRACLTNDNFSKWFGTATNDSIEFRTEYYIQQYECGPGKRVMDQNFNCIMQVNNYEYNDINSCMSTFNTEISQGKDFCRSYNEYIRCIDQIYGIICGPQVRELVCQIEEIGLEVNSNQCNRVLQNCRGGRN